MHEKSKIYFLSPPRYTPEFSEFGLWEKPIAPWNDQNSQKKASNGTLETKGIRILWFETSLEQKKWTYQGFQSELRQLAPKVQEEKPVWFFWAEATEETFSWESL